MKQFDIVLSDIKEILKRKKKTIYFFTLLIAFLAFMVSISQDTFYLAEGTFRDKGSVVSMRQSMSDMLMGAGGDKQDSEVISVMHSARLMEGLIKKQGLQGTISEINGLSVWLEAFRKNLTVEWAYLTRQKVPALPDPEKTVSITDVNYAGEKRVPLEITFIDENRYQLESGEIGTIGEKFSHNGAEFTLLVQNPSGSLADRKFSIMIFPLKHLAKELALILTAKVDQDDRGLIRVKYLHPDRQVGSEFVNNVMQAYQQFLEVEHARISEAQLSYLKRREGEIAVSFENVMEDHVRRVKSDLSASGFTDSKKELEFLSAQLLSTNNKLMQIKLDEKRLEKVLSGDVASFDHYSPGAADASIINEMLHKMRELKLTQDSLNLALEGNRHEIAEGDFAGDLTQLKILNGCCEEADRLLDGNFKSKRVHLDDPRFMLSTWEKRLKNNEIDEAQFDAYIEGLKHLINMQIRAIEERLHHRLKAPQDFQGITLNAAKEIYLALSRDRQENDSSIRQLEFVIKQLHNEDFEITSLTAVLKDPVSHEKIMKASNLSHSLKDTSNRTLRELDRIKEELRIQKEFLSMHLSETIKLLELRGHVLDEKSLQLQSAMLEMAGREVTVLEKQLYDYITTRLYNLQIEKRMIQDQQTDLKKDLAAIPDKWLNEQLLDQHLQRNQRMVENITSMVESKNISNNLELVQSSPLDWAVPPLHPKPPRVILFTLVGAFLGALFSSLYYIAKGILRDIPLTEANLSLNGFKAFGKLSFRGRDKTLPPTEANKEVIRHALMSLPASSKTVLFLRGKGPDCGALAADLYRKKGLKTLHLNLDFSVMGHMPGLKQALRGEANWDEIIQDDVIYGGGKEGFSHELLMQLKFKELLDYVSAKYERVVASSSAPITSAEAENLIHLFDNSLVTLRKENFSDLKSFIQMIGEFNDNRKVEFLCSKL